MRLFAAVANLPSLYALSHSEALGLAADRNAQWVEASDLEAEAQLERPKDFHAAWQAVCTASGILVPGGFGLRGTEGMIAATRWAREKKVPFLGICLGFQVAVIEYARSMCGLKGALSASRSVRREYADGCFAEAHSAELLESTPDPVVIFMPEISKTHLGGTMRLGLRPTIFAEDAEWSIVRKLYGNSPIIWERHRHRYEINPAYVQQIEAAGLRFTGKDERGERMQVAELEGHPYFVGMQSHPEFCTRPLNPSPGYLGFIAASSGCLEEQVAQQANYVPPHPTTHLRVPSPIPGVKMYTA